MPSNLIDSPYSSHIWSEEELRMECMTIEESQCDLEQMIDSFYAGKVVNESCH